MGKPLTFFLIAGEPSGDALGAALMAGLRTRRPDAKFVGIGGPLMEAEGLSSLFPMQELSIMGIAEVLPKLPGLLSRIRQTATQIEDVRPDALITIDSPDFCLRVVRKVRAANPAQRVVHYVAPSVWAWRPERAAKMAPLVDQVLCLLPFEPAYMEAEGMRADFVGHPIAGQALPIHDNVSRFRKMHKINKDVALLLALPGSRRGEIDRLAPLFGSALKTHCAAFPRTRIVVPTVAAQADRVRALVKTLPGQPIVLAPGADTEAHKTEKAAAFAAADLALAASGTVSLELAANDTPMVIAYDMNWISRRIIASKLKIDTVTLVNLVSETRAVPELLGKACTPDAIAAKLAEVANAQDAQRDAMRVTMERLGRGGPPPGLRAADAVLDALPVS